MINSTREVLRERVFNRKPKIKIVHAFDSDIEVRQPPFGQALEFSARSTSDAEATIDLLIQCCFVPDSGEAIFELADRDSLKSLPFNDDVIALTSAVAELTGGNIEVKAKKSD